MAILSTRPHPSMTGYVSADEGTVSAMTAATLTVIEYSLPLVYTSSTKKITLSANTTYIVMVNLGQTGGSATYEIYDTTNSAVLATSGTGAGVKSLLVAIRNTTAARDIQIRVDDQSANGSVATTNQFVITEL